VRISFVVYGLLYLMVELVGAQLEQVGWPQLTALDVATAVVHAVFTISVGVAALLVLDLLARSWRRSRQAALLARAQEVEDDEPGTITVQAWRPGPLALTAAPAPPPFSGPDYADPAGDASLPLYVPSEILDRDGRRL
jgi:hypothetical protein